MLDDRIENLLSATDAALAVPQRRRELADRVRQRKRRRDLQRRSMNLAGISCAGLIAAIIGIYQFAPRPSPPMGLDVRQIVRLRAEADSLGAEADALQRQIDIERSARSQQDLCDQYRNELAKAAADGGWPSAVDRAALIALGQGDFYLDSQRSPDEAKAQYQSVVNNFPDSRWAQIARDRLDRLKMD
jgi:hypothetical protein